MSTEQHGGDHQVDSHHDLHDDHGPKSFWLKYVFSTDHKVIGLQFMFTSLMFVIIGGLLALGVRYEIAWPQQNVPHVDLLPLGMTSPAPKANVAAWKVGGEVQFASDTEIKNENPELPPVTYPKDTRATLKGFSKGIGVIIPKGTKVEGKEFPLGSDREAWIDPSEVLLDYNYKYQRVRASVGTKVWEHEDGVEAAKKAGVKPMILVAGPDVQVYADPVLLPVRREVTKVTIHVHAQNVPEIEIAGRTQVEVKEAEFDLVASQVNQTKDTLTPDAFGQLFTMHASIMIFFVIIPMLVGAFGNFLIPLMIGAKDMAFPKLNMLSFWLAMPAGIVMIISFWVENGPSGGGWTMYPPLSDMKGPGETFVKSNLGTTLWIVAVGLVGFSSIVGALNYITTSLNMRCPGMTLTRMPLTVWSILITSILALMGTPVLTATAILLLLDRTIGTQFFLDTMLVKETIEIGGQTQEVKKLVAAGGQPLLWQHLFWFYSHPAVYIMILPAMGLTSDILSTFSRKPIFGYKPMIWALAAITGLGFIVWGHHMFQSGMNPVLGTTFMASTIMIAVPSAIKTFNWLGTIWGGNIKFSPSMLFAIGFVSMFVIGGLSGIFMASAPIDIHIHDTYFIVAHIHYVLFGGSLMGIFAGVYHWYPKMFGKQLNQKWGVIHFIMTIIAFNGTFFLMHVLGIGGHPRRYASIMEYPTLTHLQGMNVFMTISAMMLGTAQIPFIYNFFVSLPRKLGRAIAAFMLAGLVTPIVIGLSHWGAQNGGGWTPEHGTSKLRSLVDLVATSPNYAKGEGVWRYNSAADVIGSLALISGLIALTVMLLRGLTRGGRIATVFVMVPAILVGISWSGYGTNMYKPNGTLAYALQSKEKSVKVIEESVASAETNEALATSITELITAQTVNMDETARETLSANAKAIYDTATLTDAAGRRESTASLTNLFASLRDFDQATTRKTWHEVAVATGHGFIFIILLVGVVWLAWAIGGAIRIVPLLNRAMYAVFLPAFLAPAILKHDTYMWLDGLPLIGTLVDPSWFDARWLILLITALPGALYVGFFQPADRFGYDDGTNPWQANSLEWVATTSPPLAHGNFDEIPTVYRGPYEYSSPAVEEDWLPQTRVLPPGVHEPEAH